MFFTHKKTLRYINNKVMWYLWLHAVTSCDELGVATTFFGQTVDESGTGPFTDPEREAPVSVLTSTFLLG